MRVAWICRTVLKVLIINVLPECAVAFSVDRFFITIVHEVLDESCFYLLRDSETETVLAKLELL